MIHSIPRGRDAVRRPAAIQADSLAAADLFGNVKPGEFQRPLANLSRRNSMRFAVALLVALADPGDEVHSF